MLYLLLACGEKTTPDSVVQLSEPNWNIGDEQPCDAPLSSPSWTDQSTLIDVADAFNGERTEGGVLSLVRVDGAWVLVTDYPNGLLKRSALDGSPPQDIPQPFSAQNSNITDIDGDNLPDLLVFEDGLAIQWGMSGDFTVLVEPTGERGIFDLSVADYNND
ncbi:MAG: hypothetical protein ACI8RZ_007363, partial [Myxococcota bacterium]